ncbi:CHAT domain-containing protein [Saccharothrix sp. HUAS TT1]|uniref:CHAT domain-containing protein n=1 Tax=unclassified Saccharothrix TaxID=2593673 RepID=UPI00345C53F9
MLRRLLRKQAAAEPDPALRPDQDDRPFIPWSGRTEDLDPGIEATRRVFASLPRDHPLRDEALNSLFGLLQQRANALGRPEDLDEAVDLARAEVAAAPGDPDPLDLLGRALSSRYERTRHLTDLADALTAHRHAVNRTPVDDPAWPWRMTNLSVVLRLDAHVGDREASLNAGIEVGLAAVRHMPDDRPGSFGALSNLATLYDERFEATGAADDLDQAVELLRRAVDGWVGDPLSGATTSTNLGVALLRRFELAGVEADLAEAERCARRAVADTPAGYWERGRHLAGLHNVLRVRFGHTGDPAALAESEEVARSLARSDSAHPQLRLPMGFALADAAERAGDTEGVLDALRLVNRALREITWPGLDRRSREHLLGNLAGMAGEVAARAIAVGRPDFAVESLEQNRLVLWGQESLLRADVSELAGVAPGLTARLDAARAGLDGATADPTARARAARSWAEALAEVRRLPGWEDFLAPLPFARLRAAAAEGPVVLLNVGDRRCDALVVTDREPSGVLVVPLPTLDPATLPTRANHFLEAMSYAAQAPVDTGFLTRERFRGAAVEALAWLWDEVAEPVLTALGVTGPADELPRVWWCPVGALALLPVHAAGHYEGGATGRSVPERVISSYTTGLGDLLRARHRAPGGPARLLAVGASDTGPDLAPLPGVARELADLGAVFGTGALTVRTGPAATRAAVAAELPEHTWLHLAGHTLPTPDEASRTGIALSDGPLTVLDVAGLRSTGGELAYLSACLTMMGSGRITDEAVHLPAALALAGYRHVIATQWHIEDRHAGAVAGAVYRRLVAGGEPDAARAAVALHEALVELRAGAHPVDWAPYVHIGP